MAAFRIPEDMPTVKEFLDIMREQLDYIEKETNNQLDDKTANAGDGNWTKYARDLKEAGYYGGGNKNGYPWCDVVYDWGMWMACGKDKAKAETATCQTGIYGAGCNWSAKYYRNKGRFYTSGPKPGDQIFFGSIGSEYHTGAVEEVKNGRVYTLEGNTSGASGVVENGGMFLRKSYASNYHKIAGYGRPYFRDAEDDTTSVPSSTTSSTVSITYPTLRKGSKGDAVLTAQNRLILHGYTLPKSGADGDFGDETEAAVRKFQRDKGLEVDGIIGKNTWAELRKDPEGTGLENFIREVQKAIGAGVDGEAGPETLSKTPTISATKNRKHAVVKPVQKWLAEQGYTEVGEADGTAGPKFTAAVKHYQKDHGCESDGEITAKNKTWRKLLGME